MNFNTLPQHVDTAGSYQERVLRKPEVVKITGLSNTSIFEKEKAGLFPTRISIGTRAIGYIYSEISALVAAQAAGYNEEQIRNLLKLLETKRKTNVDALISSLVA